MSVATPGRVREYDCGELTPLHLPLADVTKIEREGVLLGNDHIRVCTALEEYVFHGGWALWAPELRRQLTGILGREVIEESPEVWRVT